MSTTKPPTLVAPEDRIQGTLRVQGPLEIFGTVEGDVFSGGPVTIGQGGQLRGRVEAPLVRVAGTLFGDAEAAILEVLAGGRVEGRVRYEELRVVRGGEVRASLEQRGAEAEDVPLPA